MRTRNKKGQFVKGCVPWIKGRKMPSGENSPCWKEKIQKKCLNCGKIFELAPSKKDRKFCSEKCYHKYSSQHYRGKNHPLHQKRIVKVCSICGRNFEVRLCEKERKYCSRECYMQAKRNNQYPESGFQSKENHWNWKGGVSFLPYPSEFNDKLKEKIRQRDNYTCQICGKKQEELMGYHKKFPVHHIDYNKNNCREDNLITLCIGCHAMINKNRSNWKYYFYERMRSLWGFDYASSN